VTVRYATAYLPSSPSASGPSKCYALAVVGKGETIMGEVVGKLGLVSRRRQRGKRGSGQRKGLRACAVTGEQDTLIPQ
jgi:hypothetical protein